LCVEPKNAGGYTLCSDHRSFLLSFKISIGALGQD
jgi:hypothetical protein